MIRVDKNSEEVKEEEKGGIISVSVKEDEELLLYSILPEDFINENGLLSVAVAGKFLDNQVDDKGTIVVDSFEANPDFVNLLHEFLESSGRQSEILIDKLTKQDEGSWVFMIDQRVKDVSAEAQPKDVIGGYKIEDGKLGEYAGNPSHVLLTEDGIFQIGVQLKSDLIDFIRSKYEQSKEHTIN
ncbi:MAG: hypothetical protein V3U71_13435 [Cocleimonas sp.]